MAMTSLFKMQLKDWLKCSSHLLYLKDLLTDFSREWGKLLLNLIEDASAVYPQNLR